MIDISRFPRPANINDDVWPDLVTLPLTPIEIVVDGKIVVIPRYYENGNEEPFYKWLAWITPKYRALAYKAFIKGFDFDVIYQYVMKDDEWPDINNSCHIREGFLNETFR